MRAFSAATPAAAAFRSGQLLRRRLRRAVVAVGVGAAVDVAAAVVVDGVGG